MAAFVLVRRARDADRPARDELLRAELASCRHAAFLLFLFQEVTLQAVVLAGAVLFIFCGVSLTSCVMLLPAAVTAIYLMVLCGQAALAEKHIQEMRKEMCGFVLELRAAGWAGDCARAARLLAPRGHLPTDHEDEQSELPEEARSLPARLVGSASLTELWGEGGGGWLHALSFREGWRESEAARALVGAAERWARGAGLARLEAVLPGELQPAARRLLHDASWQLAGSYHRRLLGGCITLAIVHYAKDLPHA